MGKLTRIGMDTSKNVFQLHGVDDGEQPALRRKLRRQDVNKFFGGIPHLRVGMEACGAPIIGRARRRAPPGTRVPLEPGIGP